MGWWEIYHKMWFLDENYKYILYNAVQNTKTKYL